MQTEDAGLSSMSSCNLSDTLTSSASESLLSLKQCDLNSADAIRNTRSDQSNKSKEISSISTEITCKIKLQKHSK